MLTCSVVEVGEWTGVEKPLLTGRFCGVGRHFTGVLGRVLQLPKGFSRGGTPGSGVQRPLLPCVYPLNQANPFFTVVTGEQCPPCCPLGFLLLFWGQPLRLAFPCAVVEGGFRLHNAHASAYWVCSILLSMFMFGNVPVCSFLRSVASALARDWLCRGYLSNATVTLWPSIS